MAPRGLVLAITLLASTVSAAATLSGRTVNNQTQQVLVGAAVSLDDGAAQVLADANGFFHLTDAPPGPHLLRVRLADGGGFSVRLLLPAGTNLYMEFDQARHSTPADEDEY